MPHSLPNYSSLKRTIIAAVAAVILFLAAFFAWNAYSEYRLTILGAETKGKAYASALKEHAERAFGEADFILLAAIEHFTKYSDFTRQSPEHLKKRLQSLSGKSPQVGSLILVNREGILFAHSLDDNLKQADVSDRDYFRHHRDNPADDRPFISRPVKSRINGKWRFTVSRAIRDKHGAFAGLIAAAIEMEYFQRFYRSLELGQRDRIQIARRDGILIISEPFNESKFTVDFSKSHLIRTYLPRAPQGGFHIPAGQGLLERDARIVSYESFTNFPIVSLVSLSKDALVGSWQKQTYRQGSLFILVTAALLFLTVMLVRQLRKIEAAHAESLEQRKTIAAAATAWRTTFDSLEDAIWVMDMDRRISRCNRATQRMFNLEQNQVLNSLCCEVAHQGTIPLPTCPFSTMVATRQRATMEIEIDNRWYKVSVDPVFSDAGQLSGAVHIISDITSMKEAEKERELLEQKLGQSQKMEAIGHLAGGIAHDFNNLLTPIMGYAEMATTEIPAADPVLKKLAGILSAAHKAKALTQQLLSFSRSKPANAEQLDLNEVILSINDLLHRTIRENIRIELGLDPEGSLITGDRTQIEQIIINLTVNAQDAFEGEPGRIRLETCRVRMEGENARLHPGMVPGEYILFSFSDNGIGIPADVQEHIFEPFYTTKPAGHGTGLGLATVYGITRQHNAFIGVSSRHEEGTTFNIYFPAAVPHACEKETIHARSTEKRLGDGTVMLVEDNEMTRNVVNDMLLKMGYSVITACDPAEALRLAEQDIPAIDLLISDVIMPGMNGPELYERLLIRRQGLKVIFISGYPMNPSQRGGTVEDEINYLQKPFTAEALMERIRHVI